MYNLDVNMATSLNVDGPTPRTPEIVNSLIAMTNPLDYNFGDGVARRFHPSSANSDSNSSETSSTTGPVGDFRTRGGQLVLPPPTISVQQTCSQLIKAGLKLTIEQKRKLNANDNEDLLDLDKVQIKRIKKNESESEEDKVMNNNNHINGFQKNHTIDALSCEESSGFQLSLPKKWRVSRSNQLTPEDEERRRRRRERNKIAATKCRLKKRERTANLMTESETLEAQNIDLKNQYQALKKQAQDLEEVLSKHKSSCKVGKLVDNSSNNSNYVSRLPSVHSIETTIGGTVAVTRSTNNHSPYSNTDYLEYDDRPMYQYKTPSIIVDNINDDDSYHTCLADLDHPGETYSYNSPVILQQNANQQCHQNYQQSTNNASQGYGLDGCMA